MDDRSWKHAVILVGDTREMRVESLRDALICLRSFWPVTEGRAFGLAMDACQRALRGSVSPDSARRAFRLASLEAGFAVRSWI
jgi:hypothetical protein